MTGRTALFDLDGTLTNPELGITSCIAFALEHLRAPVPARDELKGWIGAPLKASFAEHLSSEAMAEEALTHYRRRFVDIGMFENEPYPGIHEALGAIRPGFDRMLVVTSKPTAFARPIIEHFAMGDYFEEIHGSELDGRNTDKAELMAQVVRQHGLDSRSTTMIGDRRFDVRAARAEGLRSIGVLWGFGDREELTSAGADRICATVPELPAALAAD